MNSDHTLPCGWAWTSIDTIAEAVGGITKGRDLQHQATVTLPYLRVANVQRLKLDLREIKTIAVPLNEVERYQLHSGDILLTEGGDADKLGRAALWHDEVDKCVHQNHIFRARIKRSDILPQWVMYYVNSRCGRQYFLQSAKQTVNLASINLSQLRRCPVPLAPLAEQRRIVAAIEEQFTRLDAGVAALKRAQAALKRYRAAVLKAAVEGKLTASWRSQHPDVQPANELLVDILAERRARWEADLRAKGKDPAKAKYDEPQSSQSEGLPELPQGWVWATVEQVFDVIGGVTKGRDLSQRAVSSVPYLRVANVQRGYLDLSVIKHIEVPDDELPRYLLQNGDTLLTEGGDPDKLGRAAVWSGQIEECIHQNHIFRARSLGPQMRPWWLAFYANSEQGQAYFRMAAKQTVNLASINLTQLRKCPMPLPPTDEQHEIVAEVEQRLSVVDALEATIATNLKQAERLRQAILERAFTGRLVPQDPDDEPASALLERVRQGRENRRIGAVGDAQLPADTARPVARLAQKRLR